MSAHVRVREWVAKARPNWSLPLETTEAQEIVREYDELKRANEQLFEHGKKMYADRSMLLDALVAFEHAFKGKTIEAHGLADTMNIGYAIEKARVAIEKATTT